MDVRAFFSSKFPGTFCLLLVLVSLSVWKHGNQSIDNLWKRNYKEVLTPLTASVNIGHNKPNEDVIPTESNITANSTPMKKTFPPENENNIFFIETNKDIQVIGK